MLGVVVNTAAVILGSLLGVLGRKIISERLANTVMIAIGLVTLVLGISDVVAEGHMLIMAGALVLGVIIGTLLDLDGALNRLGDKLGGKSKAASANDSSNKSNITQGFVNGSLIFCVGAMSVLGSLQSGISGNHETIFIKSLLDFFVAITLSVSFGIGVIYAAGTVLVYQGLLVLLAGLLEPVLTAVAIAEIGRVGGAMLVLVGLNLIGISKFKVVDFLPAIIITPLLCLFVS